ncbi:MAG: class I adenylate cyclase [Candidatus Sedimenticola sp. (ex Thyasira tokunagai)]
MSDAISYKNGIGRKELKTILRRFQSIHRERLRRIAGELRPNQRGVIDLLPLMFHINHPTLPGFVNSKTPAGIADYSPGQSALNAAGKISRSFSYKKRARRRFQIHGIYLMGSTGSIAHASGSDLDIWVCHDSSLKSEELEQLREKASRIEQWAEEISLEVHFFVMDVDAFRKGRLDSLSHESSGTAQPHLLLEEFYRTGALAAGRYPAWWLVPPEEEANYSSYIEMLFHKRFVDPIDCIDFGGLSSLPAGEFLGAAHWQLYKGIDSPYKTILKLLLTESYAQSYPDINWLCQGAKASIYAGDIDMNELDPYVLMYRQVEKYLTERDELQRLELARRCFYFKTEQNLSKKHSSTQKLWKRELMEELVASWGWHSTYLKKLDGRNSWKIDQVMEERNTLVRELTHSYRLLTDFAKAYAAGSTIDPRELSLLGRKLYTALERRPGKIDHINPGIVKNLVEHRLSLHYARTRGNNHAWFLFLGNVDEKSAPMSRPVKTSQGLIEVLTWCQHNQLLGKGTVVTLYPKKNPISTAELQSLIASLRELHPAAKHHEPPIEQLASPPRATSCALFINTGSDPLSRLAKAGKQITSNRDDPLSFGSAHSSLIDSIEQLTTTSWGETLVVRHWGTTGLLDSLCHYLRLTLLEGEGNTPPSATAHCFSSVRGGSIAKRVESLFNDVCHSFAGTNGDREALYLLQADNDYYLIQQQKELFSFFPVKSWGELLKVLGEPQEYYRKLTVDPLALFDTPLAKVFENDQSGAIQLYYYTNKNHTDLYIVDENGSLFHQQVQKSDEQYLLLQQQRFLNGIQLLRNIRSEAPSFRLLQDSIEFYQINRSRKGEYHIEQRTPPTIRLPSSYMELHLVSDTLDLNFSPYLLVCGDQEFNSLEHGDHIYTAVAEYILSKRANREAYPIYLTGLEITGAFAAGKWSTIALLNLKKRLEGRLNRALQQLAQT